MDKMTPERDAFAQLVAAIDAEVLPGYREGALPGSPADIEGLLFDLTSMFISTELGGEVGEALNVAKKLTRERLGWGGSRSTLERLAEELGDVVIVTAALAAHHGIDLQAAVASKFNDAQDRWGRDLKIAWPPSPEAAQALTILQAEREAQDRELARVETAALNLMAEKDAKITTLQGERDRLREALRVFANIPLVGKHGGPFVIGKTLYEDMGDKDAGPRASYFHKSDLLKARAALHPEPLGEGGGL